MRLFVARVPRAHARFRGRDPVLERTEFFAREEASRRERVSDYSQRIHSSFPWLRAVAESALWIEDNSRTRGNSRISSNRFNRPGRQCIPGRERARMLDVFVGSAKNSTVGLIAMRFGFEIIEIGLARKKMIHAESRARFRDQSFLFLLAILAKLMIYISIKK